MKRMLVLFLLLPGMLLICCKEKPPTPNPNDQGGPIATAQPPSSNSNGSEATMASMEPFDPSKGQSAVRVCPTSSSAPEQLNLPAGTTLNARLNEPLSSRLNHNGDRFFATVIETVMYDGQTLIPAGSVASGTVLIAESNQASGQKALLGLRLNAVCANGRAYAIQTDEVIHTWKEKSGRTAGLIGGDAGDMMGGIGSLAGGAVGTAPSSGDKEIVIGPKSVLRFSVANAKGESATKQ